MNTLPTFPVSYAGTRRQPDPTYRLNRGDVMVRLKPRSDRTRSADEVIADLRERIEHQVPEVRVEFVQVLQDVLNDLAGSPRPIEVKLFGPDYTKLFDIGATVYQALGVGLDAEIRDPLNRPSRLNAGTPMDILFRDA
jgi:Cu/Ag efflux pump CusA